MNLLNGDIEDIAERIKLRVIASGAVLVQAVASGEVTMYGADTARAARVAPGSIVGTYSRGCKTADIEAALVARRNELRAPQPKRRRRLPLSAVQRIGLHPAPASQKYTAAPIIAPGETETVAQFRARGGNVERIPGFESAVPQKTRPAWKVAA